MLGVDVMSVGIHIREDGLDPMPLQRMCGGDEGEGGNDNLAGQPERAGRDPEPERGVGHGDAMGHPEVPLEDPLELLHVRPVIGQPPPVQHVADTSQEVLSASDIRPPHVEALRKRRADRPRPRDRPAKPSWEVPHVNRIPVDVGGVLVESVVVPQDEVPADLASEEAS